MTDDLLSDPDLLSGADAIGKYLGTKRPRTFRLLENGEIPAFKLGGLWQARKSSIEKHFDNLEKAQATAQRGNGSVA